VLRADFTDQDVVLLLMANAGLIERAHGITGVAWLALDRALRTTRARCVDRSSLACSAPQPGRIGPRTRNARVSGEAFAWLASRLGVPKLGAPQVRR
jgi:hypothetical protein